MLHIAMSEDPPLEVFAFADDPAILFRPCVDCGKMTGIFCDFCLAQDRDPKGKYAPGQHTPLCSKCDRKFDMCHYCRKMLWAAPPPHQG